jgi:hypothetical protein
MAEKVYLQWTLENWITVGLMAFSIIFVVGAVASAVRHYNGNAVLPDTEGPVRG